MSRDLSDTLFQCIDQVLAGVLGLRARDNIYLGLLTKFSVTREDVPGHLGNLTSILEEDFGPGPAKNVSTAIAKRFYLELGLEFDAKLNLSFVDFVQEARRIHLKSSHFGVKDSERTRAV